MMNNNNETRYSQIIIQQYCNIGKPVRLHQTLINAFALKYIFNLRSMDT